MGSCTSKRNSIRITNAIPNSTMLVIISTQRMQLRQQNNNLETFLKGKFEPKPSENVPIPSGEIGVVKKMTEKLEREEEYRDETLYQFDTKRIYLEDGDSYLSVIIYPSTKFDNAKIMTKFHNPDTAFNIINNLKPQFNINEETNIIGDTAMIDYNAMNIQYKWYISKFQKQAEAQSIIRIAYNRPLIKKDGADIIFYIQDGFIRQGKLLPGKRFRMFESGTLQRKNYPPGILCAICGQSICCAQDCTQSSGYIRIKTHDKRVKAVQLINGSKTQRMIYQVPEKRLHQKQIQANAMKSMPRMNTSPRINTPQSRTNQPLKNNFW